MTTPRVDVLREQGFTIDSLKDLYERHQLRVHGGQYQNCPLCNNYTTDIMALQLAENINKRKNSPTPTTA